MEQLIYIDQNDKIEASKMAKNFTIEETKMRAYVNALGTELATKYLAQENINISNIYNMHSISKIRENFDIADIMLPNIHIDVRIVYDEDLIFIPKAHFEYDLTPDIYIVFKMSDDTTHVKFLGFFEPKLINKNNQNDNYYFIEKEKLSHPTDLKAFIQNFNGNTTQSLSQDELENAQRLAIAYIDDNITEDDKKSLISALTKSATLRESIAEFDNFEWISYHAVKNQDFDCIELEETQEEILISEPEIVDEFDLFDNNDEFDDFDEYGEELPEKDLDTDIVAETLHSIDVIQNGSDIDSVEETIALDSFEEVEQNEPLDELEPIEEFELTEEPESIENTESVEEIQEINEEEETYVSTENIEETTSFEELSPEADDENIEEDFVGNIEETFHSEDILENVSNTDVELENTDLEEISVDAEENISLDDGIQTEEDLEMFDEMLLDNEYGDSFIEHMNIENPIEENEAEISLEENITEDFVEESADEEVIPTEEEIPEIENNTEPFDEILEPASFDILPDIENQEKSTVDTETADIIDALLSDDILANLPDEDEEVTEEVSNVEEVTSEIVSFDTIETEPQEFETQEETTIEDIPLEKFENVGDDSSQMFETSEEETTETFSFNSLGESDEYSTNGIVEETEPPVSFDNLSEEYTTDYEVAEPYDNSQIVENIESLATEENVVEENETNDNEFLNTLETDSEEPSPEEINEPVEQVPPTVFENSVVITNENNTAGEIPIDINKQIEEEFSDDDIEKLGVLYNEANVNEAFEFATTQEKGKKAIVAAGLIVATIAGLLVFSSMNKSDEKIAENQKPNILEKNIPESLDKDIPKLPEQNIPAALTPIEPEGIEKVVAQVPPQDKGELEKIVKEAKADLVKQKNNPIETPYLEVQKLTWSVPDYLSYNDQFKRYLQTAGKSLKLSLSSDLLLATEYAYSNQISVNITLAKEGTFKDAQIGQSSGSTQIDAIVLRTVKETLNVVKAPAGLIISPTANLTLKIYL